jgi:hypothetical protein
MERVVEAGFVGLPCLANADDRLSAYPTCVTHKRA